MSNPNLLIIFIALTTLAVLIQTGILAGVYLASTKLSRQAEEALDAVHGLIRPLEATADTLRTVTEQISRLSAETETQLRRLQAWLNRRAA